ncbi:MAG TPA: hypothetical protein VKR55_31430 [Bradyrhizobium sp.]|uniref:hypothetical protein n=1 Tax=Bradyrhizobium sp. TaxID=376 RepID=UPI002CF97BA1|nr:hypothetical protein [Bradyrhizobium sp.]HLZ06644.1 hypothetical protein [Bradyrhizobium sp.]
MTALIDHTRLHRTAKYFMDSGRAATHDDAMRILRGFGASIRVGPELATSIAHQVALLTLVNLARRTLLGGVEVLGVPDAPLLVPLARARRLANAVLALGGTLATTGNPLWPIAQIGTVSPLASVTAWQLTWQGWRGGVVPRHDTRRLSDDAVNPLAAVMAAAAAAAELFAWHANDHPMAGRRTAGLSLWNPGADWLGQDASEPALTYLPASLWLIGLGNLGQAFAWLLACLPYADRSKVELTLQDYDLLADSNDSTSLLSSLPLVGAKKTRAVASWLEAAGFNTALEERRFGPWTLRGPDDPAVAFCGVDNAPTRADLGSAKFELVVEAGLGAGPGGFRNFSLHTFPSSRRPDQIWRREEAGSALDVSAMPAYSALKKSGLDICGLAQLASRTVGVPFVGLIAAGLAVSELLRRLHGAGGVEVASGSALNLDDVECVRLPFSPYAFGHLPAV